MATYTDFKKISEDQIDAFSLQADKLPSRPVFSGVQWIYNERGLCCGQCSNYWEPQTGQTCCGCCEQANGKCCQWTVPDKASQVTFEIWSGGGSGAGFCAGALCTTNGITSIGGAGGNYALKTISVTPGSTYTVCAGGTWPCVNARTCIGVNGCTSFVTGCNLSNFCVLGGCGGIWCASDPWGPYISGPCVNQGVCGWFGADYGIMGTVGGVWKSTYCNCNGAIQWTGAAPLLGIRQHMMITEQLWENCGCFVNWPAGGGLSGGSTLCNLCQCQCLGVGLMGGSGIVKITYA